jgi:hypothetical protein
VAAVYLTPLLLESGVLGLGQFTASRAAIQRASSGAPLDDLIVTGLNTGGESASRDVIGDLRRSLEDSLFFRMRIAALEALATWWTVGRERDAPILLVGDAFVSDDVAGIELDLDLVFAFPDFHRSTDPAHPDRVAVAV